MPTRRHLLLGFGALLVSASPGCRVFGADRAGPAAAPTPAPDPLLEVSAAARSDAVTAAQLATLSPAQGANLRAVAAERTAHARALDAEISRAAGTATTAGSSASPTPSGAPPGAAPPPAAPTVAALRASLHTSQRNAASLALTVPGYRSGLVGSVAAACAAELAVLL